MTDLDVPLLVGSIFTLYAVISVSQVFSLIICYLSWGNMDSSYQHLLPETPSDSHFTPQDQKVNYTQAMSSFTLAAALSALGLVVVMSNTCHLESGKIKYRRWGRKVCVYPLPLGCHRAPGAPWMCFSCDCCTPVPLCSAGRLRKPSSLTGHKKRLKDENESRMPWS